MKTNTDSVSQQGRNQHLNLSIKTINKNQLYSQLIGPSNRAG